MSSWFSLGFVASDDIGFITESSVQFDLQKCYVRRNLLIKLWISVLSPGIFGLGVAVFPHLVMIYMLDLLLRGIDGWI